MFEYVAFAAIEFLFYALVHPCPSIVHCSVPSTNITNFTTTARDLREHHDPVEHPGVQQRGQRADPLEGHPALRTRQGTAHCELLFVYLFGAIV